MNFWKRYRRSLVQIFAVLLLGVGLVLPQLGLAQSPAPVPSPAPLSIEPYLYSAQFAQGEAALLERLKQVPNDDRARFGLGIVQLMAGVERLSQSLYRYGLQQNWLTGILPFVRLPIPSNPLPKPITYANASQILETFLADLTIVQKTLEPIADPTVKLPLRLGAIRLDIDKNGRLTEQESFRRMFEAITGSRVPEAEARAFQISFDYGDVLWLRGYCHLLSAMAETILAHDGREVFNATGHLFFAQPDTPYSFLRQEESQFQNAPEINFTDVIAFIHLLRFPVEQPARMTNALEHLQATLALSRQSWRAIGTETDDDFEWLPNPKQTGIIPGVRVTQEMIDGWLMFVDEAETLLAGKVLAPFWRGKEGALGVNLKQVFSQPQTIDVILWIQGTGAAPYLESGTLTNPNVWNELFRIFGGQFFGFAAWFN
jgi:hypothetical protein